MQKYDKKEGAAMQKEAMQEGVIKKGKIIPDYRLEVLGETCPYPAIAALEAMKDLKKGEVLEVVSDCAQSINNIPADAKNHGYEMLEINQDGCVISFLIRK